VSSRARERERERQSVRVRQKKICEILRAGLLCLCDGGRQFDFRFVLVCVLVCVVVLCVHVCVGWCIFVRFDDALTQYDKGLLLAPQNTALISSIKQCRVLLKQYEQFKHRKHNKNNGSKKQRKHMHGHVNGNNYDNQNNNNNSNKNSKKRRKRKNKKGYQRLARQQVLGYVSTDEDGIRVYDVFVFLSTRCVLSGRFIACVLYGEIQSLI